MVVFALFHVLLIVLDRIIYLKQNRTNVTLEYLYYNKANGKRISVENYEEIVHTNPEIKQFYTSTYIQNEEANYPLILKCLLQIFTVIFAHIVIFWYLPFQGNYNLHSYYFCAKNQNTECNYFSNNGYLITFYILYLFYMIFSALQIQYGLLDMRKKSLFMRRDNLLYYTGFKIFNAIPFFYEIKLLIDWTITPTALDLWKWIKFESVYDRLYETHCNMKREFKRKIGDRISVFNKISLGGCGFIILLFLILGPLILFSNLNPTNSINNVTEASLELNLIFESNKIFYNYTLFSNKQAMSIKNISNH